MRMRALHIFGGAFVAAAAALVASGPASATTHDPGYDSTGYNWFNSNRDNEARVKVNVTYHREDLNSGAGAEHVYRKIRNAAESACGDYGGWMYDLERQTHMQQCESDAIADAVARINAPELTDVYDMNTQDHPRAG